MLWKLRVEPEDHEQIATLVWRSDSSAPPLGCQCAPRAEGLMSLYGYVWSWYGADDDMLDLSTRYPSLLFTLEVHNADEAGLYPPERWFFKAGKVHKVTASIEYPDFDPSKLA